MSKEVRPAPGGSVVSLSPQEKHRRKKQVLTQGVPSVTQSIADAVIIKNGNVFFATTKNGAVPLTENHGFGLYYHDCRFLDGFEIRLDDQVPSALVSNARRGFGAVFELTNADIKMENDTLIPKDSLGMTWRRVLDDDTMTLHNILNIKNHNQHAVQFILSMVFRAWFEDGHTVRQLVDDRPGTLQPPHWPSASTLFLAYDGTDGLHRSTAVNFSPAPDDKEETTVFFHVELGAREDRDYLVSVVIAEQDEAQAIRPQSENKPTIAAIEETNERSFRQWQEEQTRVNSDSLLLCNIISRSLRDLRTLRSSMDGREYFAAGLPWFGTLFGRDSVITALQTLAFNPKIAAETLRTLAAYQGDEVDEWRDEQPGKFLHELRVGELARIGKIPHRPYYGTVDTTPLFLILLAQHAAWTGTLDLFHELRASVDRALEWIAEYGDKNNSGYIAYQSMSENGLVNQGWKDAGNSIVGADGHIAEPPIALVEVQAYVYRAKCMIADLFERAGENKMAGRLREEADELFKRFNRDYWMEDKNFYMIALQENGRPCRVISSNPGHALWAGIVLPARVERVIARLMREDMFSGWGVRTLSSRERGYNPVGYHLGTVWPHDNAFIVAGFRRCGDDGAAVRVFEGMMEAAMNFDAYQLPEVFAGYSREAYNVPVHFPVACHPQAWAAGSVLYMLTEMLGLRPEAFENQLRVVRPVLPSFADYIELSGLRVGDAKVDLYFRRTGEYHGSVDVLNIEGNLDVIVSDVHATKH